MEDKNSQKEEKEEKSQGEELEKCLRERDEYLDGWQRTKAEFINFKRQIDSERKNWILFSNLELVKKIIPIYENFKEGIRALENHEAEGKQPLREGLKQIEKQFDNLFENLRVEKINIKKGDKFNYEWCEAVRSEKNEDFEEGVVLEVLKDGYLMHGKVISHAKVIVNLN